MPLYPALTRLGMTDAEQEVLEHDEAIAAAVLDTLRQAINTSVRQDMLSELLDVGGVELLAVPLRELPNEIVSGKTANAFAVKDIHTVGDIAMSSTRDLARIRGISAKRVEVIKNFLASKDISTDIGTSWQDQALALYPTPQMIPSKYLSQWRPQLDRFTMQYVAEKGTLGVLISSPTAEFLNWRRDCIVEADPTTPDAQLLEIEIGLRAVGLHFLNA